jgi:hypothetical protein
LLADGDGSSWKLIQKKLVVGEREEAIDEAIASGEFAMALLVGAMCSREKYQYASRQYAEKVLIPGSPLHTVAMLYTGQLMPPESGSNTSFWGGNSVELCRTWRTHLAAIICNRTTGWDRIVLSLGDRLLDLGETHAAHFCYMVCGCPVASPLRPDARLTLLGCNLVPADVTLNTVGSIEAYTYTEAYEWAKRCGNPNAAIQSLQPFKLRYAMLLADLGYEEAARRYIQSILNCIGASMADISATGDPPGPLSLCILSADRSELLASLGLFEERLVSRNLMDIGGIPEPERDSQLPVYDEGDADVSFQTAHSNIHDITHSSVSPVGKPRKEAKVEAKSSRDGSKKGGKKLKKKNALPGQHLEPQMEDQVSHEPKPVSTVQDAPPIVEKSSPQNTQFVAAKPPAMHQPPMGNTPTRPPTISPLVQHPQMAANMATAHTQMPPLMQMPPKAASMTAAPPEKPPLAQMLPMAASTPANQSEKPPPMQQPPMAANTPSKQPEKPPLMQPPMASSTPSKEPQQQRMLASTPDGRANTNTKKKQIAPMSAPANLEKNAKSTPSSAGKSKWNKYCFGFRLFSSFSTHSIVLTHD